MVLEVLNTATGQEKEIKRIQMGKEKIKLSLFQMIENPKDTTHTHKSYYRSSMNLVKLQDTKLIQRTMLHFHTLTMNYQEEKVRK